MFICRLSRQGVAAQFRTLASYECSLSRSVSPDFWPQMLPSAPNSLCSTFEDLFTFGYFDLPSKTFLVSLLKVGAGQ